MTASWQRGVLTLQCGEGLAECSAAHLPSNWREMGQQRQMARVARVDQKGPHLLPHDK